MLPERPIQLIHPDPNHHRNLEIISSNVKHLHQIHTAVAVVAVVGKFHSGKSFLLNQLMGKQNGFGVGPSVRPETMGIWMWGKVRSLYTQLISDYTLHELLMYEFQACYMITLVHLLC